MKIKFCDGSMSIDKLNKINKLANEYFTLSKEKQNRILSQLWHNFLKKTLDILYFMCYNKVNK